MNQISSYFFVTAFVCSLICSLSGCYTYDDITKEDLIEGYPGPEMSIRIILNDDTLIESPVFCHMLATEVNTIVGGVGEDRVSLRAFTGLISLKEIDSSKQVRTDE